MTAIIITIDDYDIAGPTAVVVVNKDSLDNALRLLREADPDKVFKFDEQEVDTLDDVIDLLKSETRIHRGEE